ncbi:hypothetical protein BTM312_15280 [Helicobacter pylori]
MPLKSLKNRLNQHFELSPRYGSVKKIMPNIGHKGMLSTIHANSAQNTLEALSLNLSMRYTHSLDKDLMRAYFKSAIDVIVHVNRINNERQIAEILWTKEL